MTKPCTPKQTKNDANKPTITDASNRQKVMQTNRKNLTKSLKKDKFYFENILLYIKLNLVYDGSWKEKEKVNCKYKIGMQ